MMHTERTGTFSAGILRKARRHGGLPVVLFPLAALLLLCVLSCREEPIELKSLGKPPAFVLEDQNGRPFQYTPASGKVRLVFFGYTSCPDFCPTTLAKIEKAWLALSFPVEERPQVLFISIDPERDTSKKLKTYLTAFHIPITALRGPVSSIDSVTRSFGTFYRIEKKGTETMVDHSTYVFLVDQEGNVRHNFKTGDTPERIADGIRTLFAETN